jgi:hypothetical protein
MAVRPVRRAVVAGLAAAALSAVVPGVRAETQLDPSPLIEDVEAYAVYAAALALEGQLGGGGPALVVQRETAPDGPCSSVRGTNSDPAWQEAVARFDRENAQARRLRDGADLGHPYVLESRSVLGHVWRSADATRRFRERHPAARGYVTVSAVGFDASMTLAVVTVASHCNGLCGGGSMRFLQKVDGRWQPAAPPGLLMCTWMA